MATLNSRVEILPPLFSCCHDVPSITTGYSSIQPATCDVTTPHIRGISLISLTNELILMGLMTVLPLRYSSLYWAAVTLLVSFSFYFWYQWYREREQDTQGSLFAITRGVDQGSPTSEFWAMNCGPRWRGWDKPSQRAAASLASIIW